MTGQRYASYEACKFARDYRVSLEDLPEAVRDVYFARNPRPRTPGDGAPAFRAAPAPGAYRTYDHVVCAGQGDIHPGVDATAPSVVGTSSAVAASPQTLWSGAPLPGA